MIESVSNKSIGIIGGGPRALFALERLWLEIAEMQTPPALDITVYEPATSPGAGQVYDFDQPDYLKMNFPNRHIDVWSRDEALTEDLPSLTEWLEEENSLWADPDAYTPRWIVGIYLAISFEIVCDKLAQLGAPVRLIAKKVVTTEPNSEGWEVITENGVSRFHGDILLCTGHEGWRRTDRGVQEEESENITDVYPVAEELGTDKIRAGYDVAVEGLGLTMIDATLALTQGRLGSFADGTYIASGDEPRIIAPYSRTGRPVLAKPERGLMDLPDTLRTIWRGGRVAITSVATANEHLDFVTDLWLEVLNTADKALSEVLGHEVERQHCERWFADWMRSPITPKVAEERMRHSYEVATGIRKPDASWAVGEAWRQLYPALATAIGHGNLPSEAWPQFRMIANEMERVAFGSSAENVGKILQLIDAGIVDLGAHAGTKFAPDITVKAMMPEATEPADNSLIGSLEERGWLNRMPGSGAIEIDERARAIRPDCSIAKGLSVLGRATEGCVIGNDTLSRRLHQHVNNWAQEILTDSVAETASEASGELVG